MRKLRLKNKISIITVIIVFYAVLLGNSLNVKAYDSVELILSETGASSPPLFTDGSVPVVPGSKISQKFNIKNNTDRDYSIVGFRMTNFEITRGSDKIQDTSLIDYFTRSVRVKLEEKKPLWTATIFDGTMAELLDNGGIRLGKNKISISKGRLKEFLITVSMDAETDNRVQGIKVSFGTDFDAVSDDGSSANTGGGIIGGGSGVIGGTGTDSQGAGGAGAQDTGDGGTGSGGVGAVGSIETRVPDTNPITGNKALGGSNSLTPSSGTDSGRGIVAVPTGGDTDSPTVPAGGSGDTPSINQFQGGNTESANIPVITPNGNTGIKSDEWHKPSIPVKNSSFLYIEILLILGIISGCTGLILILRKNKS